MVMMDRPNCFKCGKKEIVGIINKETHDNKRVEYYACSSPCKDELFNEMCKEVLKGGKVAINNP